MRMSPFTVPSVLFTKRLTGKVGVQYPDWEELLVEQECLQFTVGGEKSDDDDDDDDLCVCWFC